MLKNILSLLLAISFVGIFIGTYFFFSEARTEKEASIDDFTKLTKSLFITQLSQTDLQDLCDCDITTISYQPLTFTLRFTSGNYIESISNPQQLSAYEASQAGASLKICGLLNAQRDISTSNRGSVKITIYSGVPFTSTQCDSLWVEGRAYFNPVPI